ncbi:aspartic peptidase domain-containing protein [Paraphoma chrysanthemicola]|uniref:Aspartic peptidase domain-containing protein n=1 Tax=Paraphoma chrysanthemicola TaxID=798071 RepID=A0A8K0QZQ5_9PLEO|nr:aspartic peptidase domain-containing protein [Paraphoma chrysanthemicola]
MLAFSCLLLSSAFISSAAAQTTECKPLAVSFPFNSNVLANRAEARGIAWQLGSPNAQTLTLLPSATYNDTYIYGGKGLCAPNITFEECTTYRGGIYDVAQSETETTGSSIKHIWDDANATWTTDKAILRDGTGSNVELNPADFGIRAGTAHRYVNQGELGLGKNSTFLNALSSARKVSSKTWSFFWGVDAAISDSPRNGSLTLGGYDRALIGDAPNTTTTFTRDEWRCREGMVVELTGLALQSEGGGKQSILNGSERIRACVVPTLSSLLTLPESYWDTMAKIMGLELSPLNGGKSGEYLYGVASVRPESAIFAGNLSITINGAVTVTIPNKQLIFDEPYIASNGLIRRNSDWKDVPIVRYTDLTQNMPRLGGMFFSAAYLMVNHDRNEFSISAASETSSQALVGIDTANSCTAAITSRGGTTNQDPGLSGSNDIGSTGLATGAIAGIVVSVIAVIAVLAGLAFLVWKRKRPVSKTAELEATHSGNFAVEKYGYTTSEMDASQKPVEFSGHSRDYAVELDGRARPAEVPGSTPHT